MSADPPRPTPGAGLATETAGTGTLSVAPGGRAGTIEGAAAPTRRRTARRKTLSPEDYAQGVLAGNRTVLARAITLVESRNPAHRTTARALIDRLLPHTGTARRIGITGVPGVGKSTFIEALGSNLTAQGHKVAVLAVDPTSARSGGSILGDKTRMARLAVDPNAYIRPSPSAGYLGGVGRMTRETMLLCEAAGFDVILIETVGAGQSETMVADMTDFFLVLMLPGAGDELQGIKKGVLELADMIAINKADADPAKARAAKREYSSALRIMTPASPNWRPPVVMVSGLKNDGLDRLWQEISRHRDALTKSGELAAKRRDQLRDWMWALLKERLLETVTERADFAPARARLESRMLAGEISAETAVETLLQTCLEVDPMKRNR